MAKLTRIQSKEGDWDSPFTSGGRERFQDLCPSKGVCLDSKDVNRNGSNGSTIDCPRKFSLNSQPGHDQSEKTKNSFYIVVAHLWRWDKQDANQSSPKSSAGNGKVFPYRNHQPDQYLMVRSAAYADKDSIIWTASRLWNHRARCPETKNTPKAKSAAHSRRNGREHRHNVTAERVRRSLHGYTNGKGEQVADLGGGFQFCKLSNEPLFHRRRPDREDVTFAHRWPEFVWFAETGVGCSKSADEKSPVLGIPRRPRHLPALRRHPRQISPSAAAAS